MTAVETIFSGRCDPISAFLPQVALRIFASASCGAKGMSTGTAVLGLRERLRYHTHPVSEAVTILEGDALCSIEGRTYRLRPLDCIHIPAGIAHESVNPSDTKPLVVFSAFASASPGRDFINKHFLERDRTGRDPDYADPEYIMRFNTSKKYELANGTEFCDLFASRFGCVGICGGYGKFQPGTSLPCHMHEFDESITIIAGEATCEVEGRRYHLSGCDTAFIPQGKPHRFLNESHKPMEMIWVYAGAEPCRSIVDVERCTGNPITHEVKFK